MTSFIPRDIHWSCSRYSKSFLELHFNLNKCTLILSNMPDSNHTITYLLRCVWPAHLSHSLFLNLILWLSLVIQNITHNTICTLYFLTPFLFDTFIFPNIVCLYCSFYLLCRNFTKCSHICLLLLDTLPVKELFYFWI